MKQQKIMTTNWSPETHKTVFVYMNNEISFILLIFKVFEKENQMKIPKFLKYNIISDYVEYNKFSNGKKLKDNKNDVFINFSNNQNKNRIYSELNDELDLITTEDDD
jgi:hypothetical protein